MYYILRRWELECGGPVTYVVPLPWVLNTVKFPVIGCPAVAYSAVGIR